jgi:hypothetical protein
VDPVDLLGLGELADLVDLVDRVGLDDNYNRTFSFHLHDDHLQ